MGSKTPIYRVIAIWINKFWFGSPCSKNLMYLPITVVFHFWSMFFSKFFKKLCITLRHKKPEIEKSMFMLWSLYFVLERWYQLCKFEIFTRPYGLTNIAAATVQNSKNLKFVRPLAQEIWLTRLWDIQRATDCQYASYNPPCR